MLSFSFPFAVFRLNARQKPVDKVPEEVKLLARIRVSAIDRETKALVDRLPVADDQEDAVYNNIQVAELNAFHRQLEVRVPVPLLDPRKPRD